MSPATAPRPSSGSRGLLQDRPVRLESSTPGKDPGVSSLLSDIQGNRCHEIDGCSAPGVRQQCADDPMMPALPLRPVARDRPAPGAPIPALANVLLRLRPGRPPAGSATRRRVLHSWLAVPVRPARNTTTCNRRGARGRPVRADSEQAWEDAWHQCNRRQFREMADVQRAYPCAPTPFSAFPTRSGVPDGSRKVTCSGFALVYLAGVGTRSNPLGAVAWSIQTAAGRLLRGGTSLPWPHRRERWRDGRGHCISSRIPVVLYYKFPKSR
jgi:hypothetical protein